MEIPDQMPVTTERELLTDSWTAQVAALEAALNRVDLGNCDGCRIVCSEVHQAGQLHVTIVKTRETMCVSGWSLPMRQADGGIRYTRQFALESTDAMVKHIRDMWAVPPV